jgi:hypothetical protein
MADETILAIEDFPTVTALCLSVLELGLVEGLDILVAIAKLGSPAAVGGECGDGDEDASVSGELVVLVVLGGLGFFSAAGGC